MTVGAIGSKNVGRIAERIVANELEYRGFRVSDLNRDGISANADLLAVRGGKTWQIQVKGASFDTNYVNGWWFGYGFCTQEILADRSLSMFNRAASFYRAQVVALVCVKSPIEYHCAVLPATVAEQAAQINLDYGFRTKKKDGSPKKPHKVWVGLRYVPDIKDNNRKLAMQREQALIEPYLDQWDLESWPAGEVELEDL